MYFSFRSIAEIFVYGGIISAFIIVFDLTRHPQKMKIMTPVWILTGIWGSYIGLLLYFLFGKEEEVTDEQSETMEMDMKMSPGMNMSSERSMPEKVALSTLHCGAGCTLADLIGETLTIGIPLLIAGSALAGQWTLDYILALLIGVLFQYAAIQPMLHLKPGKAILRALRIDFFSLTSWQIGMYAWMAITYFVIYPEGLPKGDVEFWFMMQIAMLCGFLTAYPVNWLLIKKGIKPSM